MQTIGMLAIWHDVAPGREPALREWYGREHNFERLAVPGFVSAHRYDLVQGAGGQIMCLYEVRDLAVLDSDAYRARLAAPSEWTRSMMPHYRAMSRTVCRTTQRHGRATGGYVAALALQEEPAAVALELLWPQLDHALRRRTLAKASVSTTATAETALRGGPDAGICWALLVDTETADAAQAALTAALAHLALAPEQALQCAVYRLAFAAHSDETA